VEGKSLLSSAKSIRLHPAFSFEGYPNRDSLKYIDTYGLGGADLKIMFRGTLRFSGFCEFMEGMTGLGLLAQSPSNAHSSWQSAVKEALGVDHVDNDVDWLKAISHRLPEWPREKCARFLHNLNVIGMLSPNTPYTLHATKLDTLCAFLQEKLRYAKGERDMVFMHHQFVLAGKDGKREAVSSTLCMFGNEENSAMSLTVGLTVAVAARLVLQGIIDTKGILIPTHPSLYKPMLHELNRLGINFVESRYACL
jgi:saccharopine dehydrogenase-like NADP-dependent oxidoreductase